MGLAAVTILRLVWFVVSSQVFPFTGLEYTNDASASYDGDDFRDFKFVSCDLSGDVLCALQYMTWNSPTDVTRTSCQLRLVP